MTTTIPVDWLIAAALPIVLLVAWVFSAIARWLLRGRARLGVATSIVISIIGTAAGLLIAGWIAPLATPWGLLSILLTLGMSIAGIAVYGAIAAHFQHPQRDSVAELLAAGESDRVEFKSTARAASGVPAQREGSRAGTVGADRQLHPAAQRRRGQLLRDAPLAAQPRRNRRCPVPGGRPLLRAALSPLSGRIMVLLASGRLAALPLLTDRLR
jgi:hypothetical protein